jgi:SAM-dependent methyltransferase
MVCHGRERPLISKDAVMAEDEQAPPDIDIRTPNMARMYNYALGGKDNFAADREAVQNLFKLAPENAYVPRANRQFLGTAARFVAEQGITQFIDLGAGLPSQGSTHEVARLVQPGARVVYVDSDPMVLAHARALLAGNDAGLAVIAEDIRETGRILNHPVALRLIDFSKPVAVLFVAVLHGIPDADDPARIVADFARPLAPGSYVILSHLTREGHPADIVAMKEEVWAKSATPMAYRSRDEILRFFTGLDLVEPGLTTVTRWRAEPADAQLDAAGAWTLGGVARKN